MTSPTIRINPETPGATRNDALDSETNLNQSGQIWTNLNTHAKNCQPWTANSHVHAEISPQSAGEPK